MAPGQGFEPTISTLARLRDTGLRYCRIGSRGGNRTRDVLLNRQTPTKKMVHTDGLEPPKAEARCSTGTRNCRSATYAKETQLSKIKKSELRFRLWNPPALDSRLLVFFFGDSGAGIRSRCVRFDYALRLMVSARGDYLWGNPW